MVARHVRMGMGGMDVLDNGHRSPVSDLKDEESRGYSSRVHVKSERGSVLSGDARSPRRRPANPGEAREAGIEVRRPREKALFYFVLTLHAIQLQA